MSARPRVLIVDDERGVRESLRAILLGDCDVFTASSGAEAMEVVGREPIDLVTLDLRMPGQDGISVLEDIRKANPDVEALIITGYGSFDTAVKGLRHRVFDYLAKPFDAVQVRHTVQAALARHEALRRLRRAPEQILSTLSHEFRTPLNVILGYSDMMRDEVDGVLSAEQRRALDRIQHNSTTLLSYVETLFYMVELDRGLVPLIVSRVPLHDIVDRVCASAGPQAADKNLGFTARVPRQLTLVTDGDKLERLIRVFVDNALRYTATGHVTLTIDGTSDGITIEVADSGAGVTEEVVAETATVVAGRSAEQPPERLGFGLRLAGRLVRVLRGGLTLAGSDDGTTCRMTVPSLEGVVIDAPLPSAQA